MVDHGVENVRHPWNFLQTAAVVTVLALVYIELRWFYILWYWFG